MVSIQTPQRIPSRDRPPPPGARITLRDEEWIIRRVDHSDDGGYALTCDGVSELVRSLSIAFLTRLEDDFEIHDPSNTQLIQDKSSNFIESLLYLESQRLRTVANDERIHLANRAVIKRAPYQQSPTEKGLKQIRTRILIADDVGLGKTIEAAMLATELDIRGRGRRILVVTQKSMLTQFQKEWWSRFTIPLVRLDSVGIQRIRDSIPSGHNPFNYYDKTIISMDTLKGNNEYRDYLERSRWDIIVIDECHNVAARKGDKSSSKRARLAKNLATKSDYLILLSATPHDGSAKSFASLIWLLDPTAISDPEDYTREDLDRKDLFIRRFKKDIKNQVEGQLLSPISHFPSAKASVEEDDVHEAVMEIPFTQGSRFRGARQSELQRVGLLKSLFSSPAAADSYARNRINKLQKKSNQSIAELKEVTALNEFQKALERINREKFSKYQKLLEILHSTHMKEAGRETRDRLVIFSERIETLNWLKKMLPTDLGIKEDYFDILHGGLSDIDQQKIVERFGQRGSKLRVLLCSDVASEGLNLHYFCHRLIHFDLPWSPMILQQRNGRIDRFGQNIVPEIYYLSTESNHEKLKGEQRVIDILVRKCVQARMNIGDAGLILGKYSPEEEENTVTNALAEKLSAKEFEDQCIDEARSDDELDNWESVLFGTEGDVPTEEVESKPLLFFENMFTFSKEALNQISDVASTRFDDSKKTLRITPPPDLQRRLRQQLPREVLRGTDEYVLSSDAGVIEESIQRAREQDMSGSAWPDIQYLWPQHPICQWMIDRVVSKVRRQHALVIVSNKLDSDEHAFLMLGLILNRKSQPLIAEWKAVVQCGNEDFEIEDFDSFCQRAGIGVGGLPNPDRIIDLESLQSSLGDAVATMELFVEERINPFKDERMKQVVEKLEEIDQLCIEKKQQLELKFKRSPDAIRQWQTTQGRKNIDEVFDEHCEWVQDSLEVEAKPVVQVLAGVTSQVPHGWN